ncbi:DNA-binding protein [Pseudonocardia adelaidensis]
MTRDELLALPVAVDLVTAGRALGIGRTKAHEMVRAGTWPTRVLRLGNAYRVPTADLRRFLGVDADEPPQLEAG